MNRIDLPETFNSCVLSSHYISNMWFGHSGFKANPDFNQFNRWGSRIYNVTKEIELAKTANFSISLYNHYYESSRYEIFSMIEEKELQLRFSNPIKTSDIGDLCSKLHTSFSLCLADTSHLSLLDITRNINLSGII